MKFKHRKPLEPGLVKSVKKFAFFPVTIEDREGEKTTYWLESYIQLYTTRSGKWYKYSIPAELKLVEYLCIADVGGIKVGQVFKAYERLEYFWPMISRGAPRIAMADVPKFFVRSHSKFDTKLDKLLE